MTWAYISPPCCGKKVRIGLTNKNYIRVSVICPECEQIWVHEAKKTTFSWTRIDV